MLYIKPYRIVVQKIWHLSLVLVISFSPVLCRNGLTPIYLLRTDGQNFFTSYVLTILINRLK